VDEYTHIVKACFKMEHESLMYERQTSTKAATGLSDETMLYIFSTSLMTIQQKKQQSWFSTAAEESIILVISLFLSHL
jgi:hypothetical protein